jgi:hypothetical protein
MTSMDDCEHWPLHNLSLSTSGHYWPLLATLGYCWPLLATTGHFFLLDTTGHYLYITDELGRARTNMDSHGK